MLEGINTAYASVKAGFETAKTTAASAASAASSAAANLSSASSSSSGAGASGSSDSTSGSTSDASSSSTSGASAAGPSFVEEIKATLRPVGGVVSATRMYKGPVMDGEAYEGTMELMIVKQQETAWQKTMRGLNEKVGADGGAHACMGWGW